MRRRPRTRGRFRRLGRRRGGARRRREFGPRGRDADVCLDADRDADGGAGRRGHRRPDLHGAASDGGRGVDVHADGVRRRRPDGDRQRDGHGAERPPGDEHGPRAGLGRDAGARNGGERGEFVEDRGIHAVQRARVDPRGRGLRRPHHGRAGRRRRHRRGFRRQDPAPSRACGDRDLRGPRREQGQPRSGGRRDRRRAAQRVGRPRRRLQRESRRPVVRLHLRPGSRVRVHGGAVGDLRKRRLVRSRGQRPYRGHQQGLYLSSAAPVSGLHRAGAAASRRPGPNPLHRPGERRRDRTRRPAGHRRDGGRNRRTRHRGRIAEPERRRQGPPQQYLRLRQALVPVRAGRASLHDQLRRTMPRAPRAPTDMRSRTAPPSPRRMRRARRRRCGRRSPTRPRARSSTGC